jgi:light-regulated signal transduction histidine kinase (bacteriophytochrome)
MLLNARRMYRETNQMQLILLAIEDVTERKRVEEALTHQTQELARSNAELQDFAYVASHDLKEPLLVVSGYVQLLARRYKGKLGTDADNFIVRAIDGVKRMETLINDLLAYSCAGTYGETFKPTDCKTVFEHTVTNLQAAIKESGAVVTHDRLPPVVADASQLVQLFQNLIGNAIKFRGKRQPCIHISAEEKGNEWVFSVRDNGIGIHPKYAEDIFIMFERLHNRGRYPGTGIGLALCKKIVQRHGGRIWVNSEPGKGSTFYFTISIKEGEQKSVVEQ